MQLVKVDSDVVSLRGSEVSFRVDRDVWVVSFFHKERRDTVRETSTDHLAGPAGMPKGGDTALHLEIHGTERGL